MITMKIAKAWFHGDFLYYKNTQGKMYKVTYSRVQKVDRR